MTKHGPRRGAGDRPTLERQKTRAKTLRYAVRRAAAKTLARPAIAAGGSAPDGDFPTLHIRCGSDIRTALRAAGFTGAFLELSDPFWLGPLGASDDFAGRAATIAAATGIPAGSIESRLSDALQALDAAIRSDIRLVIWCEHDPYDQFCLARVLNELSVAGRSRKVAMIAIDRFPGIDRFLGLGQLSAPALRSLWDRREPLRQKHRQLGVAVWKGLSSPSPAGLGRLLAARKPALPLMAGALRRHLQELPWIGDGLSLTQRLALRALEAGPVSFSRLYVAAQQRADPLPFMGDLFFRDVVRQMADAASPAVTMEAASPAEPWPKHRVALTALGARLVRGEADWLRAGPPPRHVANVRIATPGPHWRWNPNADRPVRRSA